MKRVVAGLLVVISATQALASFEMLLYVSDGSNSVTRVDPQSRLVLGTFGGNRLLSPKAVAVDQSASEAIVLNQYGSGVSRITVFNYHTGEFKREFGVPPTSAADIERLSNGDILIPYATAVSRYTSTGVFLGAYSGPAGSNFGSVSFSDIYNEVYAFNSTSNGHVIFNLNTYTQIGLGASNFGIGMNGSAALGASYGGNSSSVRKFTHSSLSWSSAGPITNFNQINTATFGHGSTVYFGGGGSVSQPTIGTFDGNLNQVSTLWNVTLTGGVITSMATILAPEPSSLFAIALGVLLLRKKK